MIVYHVTKEDLLDKILEKGLIPMLGERSLLIGEETPGIYFFENIVNVEDALGGWMANAFNDEDKLVILKVNISKSEIKKRLLIMKLKW